MDNSSLEENEQFLSDPRLSNTNLTEKENDQHGETICTTPTAANSSTVCQGSDLLNAQAASLSEESLPTTGTSLALNVSQSVAAATARKHALFLQFPDELFFESFTCLDRSSLDCMPLVHDRLGAIVEQRMQHICLRQIGIVSFTAVTAADKIGANVRDTLIFDHSEALVPVPGLVDINVEPMVFCRVSWQTAVGRMPNGVRYFAFARDAVAYLCARIRSSHVNHLVIEAHRDLRRLGLPPPLLQDLAVVLPTVCADCMQFTSCSFDQVDHHVLQSFLRSFSALRALKISDSSMDGVPLTDESLRECTELGITYVSCFDEFLGTHSPQITDKAIIDYLFQTTDKKVELTIQNHSITRQFSLELLKTAQTSLAENEIVANIYIYDTIFYLDGEEEFIEQARVLRESDFWEFASVADSTLRFQLQPASTTRSSLCFVANPDGGDGFNRLIRFERTRWPTSVDHVP